MHELYMHYLSAKGEWIRSSLVVSVRQEHSNQLTEVYEYYTWDQLVTSLNEELAKDLVDRHKEAEAKLPKGEKGRFIRANLYCMLFIRV